jgi:hypothetical protein
MKKLFIFFLLVFSSSVFADTYPSVTTYSGQDPVTGGILSGYLSASSYCDAVRSALTSAYPTRGYTVTFLPPVTCNGNGWGSLGANSSSTCPAGGTLSGTNCINAPSCTAPATRNSSGQCVNSTCVYPQYDNAGTCTAIPNCNTSTTGNYFDVATKSCIPAQCPAGVCVVTACLDSAKYFCPPTNNCEISSILCSNVPGSVTTADAAASAKAFDKQTSDQAVADANFAAQLADDLVAAKAAVAQDASNRESAARIAAMDINTTPEQRAQAKLDFADSAAAQQRARTEYQNAQSAAAAVKAAAAVVASKSSTINQTSTNSGNADTLAKQILNDLNGVNSSLQDVKNGNGNGTGPGSGVQSGLPSPYDNVAAAVTAAGKGVEDAVKNKKTDCELKPDSVGCSALGDVPASDVISRTDAGMSFTPSSWGGGGSCPADVSFHAINRSMNFSYAPVCKYLSFLAPVLISLSLVGAGRIVLGSVKE